MQITPAGAITEFTAGLNPNSLAIGIAPGPNGDMYFTDSSSTPAIGLGAPGGSISELSPGLSSGSAPVSITPGADGNMWFADQGSTPEIGQLGLGVPAPAESAPVVSGGGQLGAAQQCAPGSWSTWASRQPSVDLFGFDGYQWLLDGAPLAGGQSYTPLASQLGHQLSCAITVTYPLLDVTVSSTSAPVTVVPPPPTVTALHESARVWREGNKLARITRKKRPAVGTVFSFIANEQVSVAVSFTAHLAGRRVGHMCLAPTRRNAKHRGCARTAVAGTLTVKAEGGANKIAFQGRVSSARKLRPGSYTLALTATNSAGVSSAPESLSFTIAR